MLVFLLILVVLFDLRSRIILFACLTLAEIGACLGIPSSGEIILASYTSYSQAWSNYTKVGYYFSISRIPKQDFYARRARSSMVNMLILSSKNLYVSDNMLCNTPF